MKQQVVQGDGLLHDIFVKPFKPKKKVAKLNTEEGIYAQIAKASYDRSLSPDKIDMYVKDKSFSSVNSVVYTNSLTVILGIRGTDLKNPEDILTDLSVATDTLKLSTRYKEISKRFKEIRQKYQYVGKSLIPYKYIIVGHSLGASLALQLLFDNPDVITSVHLFNQGSSPADVKKGLQMKVGKALGSKFYKTVSKKIFIYRVNGDLISFVSRFLNGNYTQILSNSLNRHGMDNFKADDMVEMVQHKGDRTPAWSSSKPIIEDLQEEQVNEINEQPLVVEGGKINKLNNFSVSNKTMKQLDVDNMSLQEMLCHIRSNKKIKTSMAGYSKLNQTQLREALKKYQNDGVVIKRTVKPTAWSEALKDFNLGKDSFVIPKKGTTDYDKVKAIMNADREENKPIAVPKKKRTKRSGAEKVVAQTEPVVEGNGMKRSKVRP